MKIHALSTLTEKMKYPDLLIISGRVVVMVMARVLIDAKVVIVGRDEQ